MALKQYSRRRTNRKSRGDERHSTVKSPPSTTTFFTDASDDLILAILIRLPDCRAAIQCRTVCKRWNSLITHDSGFVSSFIHHHSRRHRNSTRSPSYNFLIQNRAAVAPLDSLYEVITSGKSSETVRRSLSFLPRPAMIIRESYKDLLLVSSFDATLEFHYICNPITRQWLALPRLPPGRGTFLNPAAYGLVFNATSLRVVLFYYGSKTMSEFEELAALVFSSETMEWTEMLFPSPQGVNPPPLFEISGRHDHRVVAASSGGTLYWIHKTYLQLDRILVFDPFREPSSWHFMASPATRILGRWAGRTTPHVVAFGHQNRIRVFREYALWRKLQSVCHVYEVWEYDGDGDSNGRDRQWRLVWKTESGSTRTVINYVNKGPEAVVKYVNGSFDPNDEDVVFVRSEGRCCFYSLSERKVVKVVEFPGSVDDDQVVSLGVFPIANFLWPTSIPTLPDI